MISMHNILSFIKRAFGTNTEKTLDYFFLSEDPRYSQFEIGEFTYGKPEILFPTSGGSLKIGKFCSIANGVTIFLGGNHRTDWVSTYPFNKVFQNELPCSDIVGHPATDGDVIIGNDVWIGTNATILSGVTIENGAVIAAGSMVTKNVGKYEIWGGNPARIIRKRFDDENIEEIEKLKWWEWDIDKIKQNTPLICSQRLSELLEKFER
jgi:acetyltransferase-like isoleucine patch superfamily enzyme